MKLVYSYACIFVLLLVQTTSCFFLPLILGGAAWEFRNTRGSSLDSLNMTAGDVIRCNLRKGLAFDHWMLALNQTHMIGTSFNHIRIQPFTVKRGFDKDSCWNDGPGSLGRSTSVRRAMEFADKEIHYDLLQCNCEHFVKHWTQGSSGSWSDNQSFMPSNSHCEV